MLDHPTPTGDVTSVSPRPAYSFSLIRPLPSSHRSVPSTPPLLPPASPLAAEGRRGTAHLPSFTGITILVPRACFLY